MGKILITGGAGFIGTHTAQMLVAEGYEVRILDILDPQIHGENPSFPAPLIRHAECVRGDVRNPSDLEKALRGVDSVFHFASRTGVGQSMYDLRDYVDTNVTGTAALLEALIKRKQPLARLVLSSSRAVYGEGACRCPAHGAVHPAPRMREDMEQGRFDLRCPLCGEPLIPAPTEEDKALSPLSVYAWTKKEQEELCRYAARTFGIPATILRYFNVYGPGQSLKNPYTGVVSIFFSRIMSGQPISLYEHGRPIRDFVHVSDVARANVAALESDVAPGACINVGTGCAVTIADVARGLAAACGREAEFGDRGEFRVGDIYSCYADIARARRLLGYGPSAGLAEGLESFATWARGEEWVDLYQRSVDELRQHDLMGEAGRRTS